MSDRLQELSVFIRTAESGSFSRSARELGLSQPSVSRIITELENRLGVALLLRTTRQVTATPAGLLFLEKARQVLAALADAEDAARSGLDVHGLLRVALPTTLGVRVIIPLLEPFLRAHPGLSLQLMTSDARQDLVVEGADVAIRFSLGPLDDSGFGARKLARGRRVLIASPGYLATRGAITTVADLAQHDCIFGPGGALRERWTFTRQGREFSCAVRGRLQVASAQGVLVAVIAGMGIARVSALICEAELAAGAVVRVLPDYEAPTFDVYAIYPSRRKPSAKVRAFVDYIAKILPL
jgi:DNA-binding transcriptional LysR family regulator